LNSGITPPNNQNDVVGWFDGNNQLPGNYWDDTWQSTTNLPTGHSGGVAAFSGVAGASNFLYQAIGARNAGDTTLNFAISVGAFTDLPGIRTGTGSSALHKANY
jgi:hypothetical protein